MDHPLLPCYRISLGEVDLAPRSPSATIPAYTLAAAFTRDPARSNPRNRQGRMETIRRVPHHHAIDQARTLWTDMLDAKTCIKSGP